MLVKTFDSSKLPILFSIFKTFKPFLTIKNWFWWRKVKRNLFHPTPLFNFMFDKLSNQSIDLALVIRKRRWICIISNYGNPTHACFFYLILIQNYAKCDLVSLMKLALSWLMTKKYDNLRKSTHLNLRQYIRFLEDKSNILL